MYLFCRRMGVGGFGAAVGGVGFAMGGFLTTRLLAHAAQVGHLAAG